MQMHACVSLFIYVLLAGCKMRTIELLDVEDVTHRRLHDNDLQHHRNDQHSKKDGAALDAGKDVVLVKDFARVDLVEDLHEDERIEQQAFAALFIILLSVVVEAVRVAPLRPDLHTLTVLNDDCVRSRSTAVSQTLEAKHTTHCCVRLINLGGFM